MLILGSPSNTYKTYWSESFWPIWGSSEYYTKYEASQGKSMAWSLETIYWDSSTKWRHENKQQSEGAQTQIFIILNKSV